MFNYYIFPLVILFDTVTSLNMRLNAVQVNSKEIFQYEMVQ
jgi:hypothetical protein